MMQRGYRTLFSDFIEEPPVKVVQRRGRSEELHQERNELLIHRYYYFIKVLRMQYADALQKLRVQLFIEERTIIDAVQQNRVMLKKLHEEKPTAKYFRDKYPFMNWN